MNNWYKKAQIPTAPNPAVPTTTPTPAATPTTEIEQQQVRENLLPEFQSAYPDFVTELDKNPTEKAQLIADANVQQQLIYDPAKANQIAGQMEYARTYNQPFSLMTSLVNAGIDVAFGMIDWGLSIL